MRGGEERGRGVRGGGVAVLYMFPMLYAVQC